MAAFTARDPPPLRASLMAAFQNATTSPEERTSAGAEGGKLPHREEDADGLRRLPLPSKVERVEATHQCPVVEQSLGKGGELSDWPFLLL